MQVFVDQVLVFELGLLEGVRVQDFLDFVEAGVKELMAFGV